VAGKPILAGAGLVQDSGPVRGNDQVRGSGLVQDSDQVRGSDLVQDSDPVRGSGQAHDQQVGAAVVMPSGISRQAELPEHSPHAAMQALAAVEVAEFERAVEVAAFVAAVAVAAVAVAAVAVAED
jgi:hypothetical protein